MLQAALRSGTAHRRSVFELFPRRLPEGRRYGVVAGVGPRPGRHRGVPFDDEALAALDDVVDAPTLEWLARTGSPATSGATREGEAYFPYSPLLIVEASFAEAVLLETVLLSIYNHDCAIASAASRMTLVAGDRPCIEMGSRRTHEEAAVAAARAAYVAGFASTLEPGRPGALRRPDDRHQRAQLHAAARHRAAGLPRAGRLARRGHHAAGRHLRRRRGGAARRRGGRPRSGRGAPGLRRPGRAGPRGQGPAGLPGRHVDPDRGDQRPRRARHRRAVLGPGRRLRRGHPAGRRLGHPTCGFVYKLVAREDASGALEPVAKRSAHKESVGGRKWARRRLDGRGVADAELVGVGEPPTARIAPCRCRW